MSDPKLYRPYVSSYRPVCWIDEGWPVTVHGAPMVRFAECLVPAAGWSGTRASALYAAAAELEAQALLCTAEAARLRKEADHVANG